MKYLLSICLVILFSCNSGTNSNKNTDQKLPSPLKENPEADAIPQDMEIKNDSDVMPNPAVADTIPMMDTPRVDQKH